MPPFCARCGLPFDYDAGADSWCGACVSRSPPYERARAAMTYDDLSRDLILAFKHGDRLDLTPLAVSWLRAAGGALIADADVVVPVPMHPRRLLRRRYNQAAVLAQGLGAIAGIEVAATALRRTRRTAAQSGLGRTAREKNLRRAIAPTEAARPRLAGRRLLLIDDVFTTGCNRDGVYSGPVGRRRAAGRRLDPRSRDLGHLDLFEADRRPVAYGMARHLI